MQTLTLTIADIERLKTIRKKLCKKIAITENDYNKICDFIAQLPSPSVLINERFPLDENFEIEVIDIQTVMPHLQKWIALFSNLPKNGNAIYPEAGWFDASEDCDFWRRNVIIEASFIPSIEFNVRLENQTIGLNLKTDGTAEFEFYLVEDAKKFPDLFNFNGTWKEAYLLTVQTILEGWPQTKFPSEFEPFLKM